MPKLSVITKGLAVGALELGEGWITVGRSEGNLLQVPEESVSGRHCEVRVQGGELFVRDLCSTNGTFLAGEKITEAALKPGQTFQIGEVELRFEASVTGGAPFNSKMLTGAGQKSSASASGPRKPSPTTAARTGGSAVAGDDFFQKYQVLFVDDSMAFLETFSELCLEMSNHTWEIRSATSADQALALLLHHPVDMVILDLGIPMVDGIQLLGIIKRRYPAWKIAVLTGRPTEENRAACLAGGADLFIEKPVSPESFKVTFNLLNDLVSWTYREGCSGTMQQVGLQELIQMECNAGHSSILEIRNQHVSGQIYIENGAITHATMGTLAGEKAVYRLLSLTDREVQLKSFMAPPQRTVSERWEQLLMEAARCFNEETVVIAREPVAPASESPAAGPVTAGRTEPDSVESLNRPVAIDPGENFVVVATYDGKWNPTDDSKK